MRWPMGRRRQGRRSNDIGPHRWQASSHRYCGDPCGSWLASDEFTTDSKPYCIPERIVPDVLDQSSSQRVGYQISSCGFQVFISTYCTVVKALLPKRPFAITGLIHRTRASGFGSAHQCCQRAALQFHHPMEMVGHYDPRQGHDRAFFLGAPELIHQSRPKCQWSKMVSWLFTFVVSR